MSDEHEHPIPMRYTLRLNLGWWRSTIVIDGIGSSLKDGELLIFGENGTFTSINFSRVIWMRAEKI